MIRAELDWFLKGDHHHELFVDVEPRWSMWMPWPGRWARWWWEVMDECKGEPLCDDTAFTTHAYVKGGSGGSQSLSGALRKAAKYMRAFTDDLDEDPPPPPNPESGEFPTLGLVIERPSGWCHDCWDVVDESESEEDGQSFTWWSRGPLAPTVHAHRTADIGLQACTSVRTALPAEPHTDPLEVARRALPPWAKVARR